MTNEQGRFRQNKKIIFGTRYYKIRTHSVLLLITSAGSYIPPWLCPSFPLSWRRTFYTDPYPKLP